MALSCTFFLIFFWSKQCIRGSAENELAGFWRARCRSCSCSCSCGGGCRSPPSKPPRYHPQEILSLLLHLHLVAVGFGSGCGAVSGPLAAWFCRLRPAAPRVGGAPCSTPTPTPPSVRAATKAEVAAAARSPLRGTSRACHLRRAPERE